MDIERYLKEKQDQLSMSRGRIQNSAVFDFNYVPERPLMREEVKPVIDALLRYAQTDIPNNILVLGSRGSGKSVLAKYLMKLLFENGPLDFAYVNCRQHNTSFKILAYLLGVKPRGCSLDELWARLTDLKKQATVFILDEVDLMSDKDRHKDILYFISRSPNNYMGVLLSNNPKFLSSLDESIKSTLQPEIVHFRSYDTAEIAQILVDRAKIGLKMVPQTVIREIAAMTVKNTNSDVRVAIKTLYLWALEPGVSLKEHYDKARRNILLDVVKDLNDQNLLMLRASLSQQGDFVKDIYGRYRKMSAEFHEEPYSYVHFYSNLSYLQSLGLLVLVSTKVNRTYTNRISLTFDPSILARVWENRFG